MIGYPIQQFGAAHLKSVELPTLQIAIGMALIRVHAVSLNYRDLMMVEGRYNSKMALPRIPCSDGAGEVVAIGEGVSRVRVGDRVCGIFMQRWLEGPLTAENRRGRWAAMLMGCWLSMSCSRRMGLFAFRST